MKQAPQLVLVLALAAAPACGKHNEVDVLHHEAIAAAKFYAPQLAAFEKRADLIFERGKKISAQTPGVEIVGSRLSEAKDVLQQLKAQVTPGADGKSAVEKTANEAAKNRKVGELEKLVHETNEKLEHGITVINDDLASVESWLAYYDRKALAMPVAPPPPTIEQPTMPGGTTVPEGGAPGAGGPGAPGAGAPGAVAPGGAGAAGAGAAGAGAAGAGAAGAGATGAGAAGAGAAGAGAARGAGAAGAGAAGAGAAGAGAAGAAERGAGAAAGAGTGAGAAGGAGAPARPAGGTPAGRGSAAPARP